jgi:hypothetical protein
MKLCQRSLPPLGLTERFQSPRDGYQTYVSTMKTCSVRLNVVSGLWAAVSAKGNGRKERAVEHFEPF